MNIRTVLFVFTIFHVSFFLFQKCLPIKEQKKNILTQVKNISLQRQGAASIRLLQEGRQDDDPSTGRGSTLTDEMQTIFLRE